MSDAKWERLKEAFDAGLRLKPDDRARFLAEVCKGDESLRCEVESLLASFEGAENFMAKPIIGEPQAVTIAGAVLTNGQNLGRYEILELIGEGGMGQVYLAQDARLNRRVALKVLSVTSISDQEAGRRLWREARAAAMLDHPNICAIYEVAEADGRQYIVMQYVRGETLAQRLEQGRISLGEVLDKALQVAGALEEAHAHGIIHCDIKPANIIITDKGHVKVLDFGLAKFTEDLEAKSKVTAGEFYTKADALMGTVPFMSPEQVRGRRLDARSDIFSFGTMIYEMAGGRQPFARDTDAETISAILRHQPSWEEIPQELTSIVHKCLMKNPDERYQSVKDLAADLRAVQERLGSHTAALEIPEKLPRSGAVLAAAKRSPSSASVGGTTRGLRIPLSIAGVLAIALGTAYLAVCNRPLSQPLTFEQITNFTDSAVSPALSLDGRMVAFFRSDNWFLTRDQIYVKRLPDGEPVQITSDPRRKYGLAFSPDGSRIAYTANEPGPSVWKTVILPSMGGNPSLLLSNAAGFTWLDERRFLFSEIRTGNHMGVVSSGENRSEWREIYFPQDERGMAHFSYASPDRKWALVVEMNPVWQPCRLIPLDGSSAGRQVGPRGRCTSAAWSPDGRWMYFGVEVEGKHHLWRQGFPAGQAEQITSGPTEEDGIAVAPDGRSLITSIGMHVSALWIRDARGERPLSSEGHVVSISSGRFGSLPTFSRSGRWLFYLKSASAGAPIGLWRTDLASEKGEPVARPETSILEYDISADEKYVVFSTQPSGKPSQTWLASLDGSTSPRLVSSSGEDSPHFGPDGEIVCRRSDGRTHYLARMNRDGSGIARAAPYPVGNVVSISPDRRWIVTISPLPAGIEAPDGSTSGTVAIPLGEDAPRVICLGCGMPTGWAPDGKFFYVGRPEGTGTYAIPVPQGETFPNLPPAGIRGLDVIAAFPGSSIIDEGTIAPGLDPSVFAYVKTTMHRNLFRIPLSNR